MELLTRRTVLAREGTVSGEVRRYGDCWIKCEAIPQSNRDGNGAWDCAVYVFASDPGTTWLHSGDGYFQTMLHGLPTEANALAFGLRHAHNLIDSSKHLPLI